ncbi:8-amino-7-oxononanoate synthase [Vogesella sp. GCM10023246]|uniref:8-amino-7-oxononanoate synthase n=1 Tax=Vogesella oryzagri TaxID=3160864 RepID=A0ABV1M4M3_9NEIS
MRPDEIDSALSALAGEHRLRRRATLQSPQGPRVTIDGRDYLAFASNDYLGLANHPALRQAMQQAIGDWGVGGGSSALVAGHFGIQQQAEEALAEFVGCEAALLFGSGYAANLGVITSLVGRGDAVFADRLNHASLNDGCLLSRATFKRFRHNDLAQLEQLLRDTPARTRLIAVDAVYSMDGDEAPLRELLQLAERYDAWLYLDDAHGFGLLGDGHGALLEYALHHPRVVYMATLGKAAGVAGAFVAGSRQLIDWLVNSARTYIFTTAHPPAQAAAILRSLQLIDADKWRRHLINEHISALHAGLRATSLSLCSSRSPIQPIIIGSNKQVLKLAEQLRARGIWVPAIRPPTVPAGSARLRVSLSAGHTRDDVAELLAALLSVIS